MSFKVKIIDISPEIHSGLSVWPGDTPFQRDILMDTDKGDHLGLSKVTTTLHLGAHTDAPNHYAPKSEGISERSLHYYLGPCQVIAVDTERGERIKPEDLKGQSIRAPRVLFKTGSFPDPDDWNDNFCSLSKELIEFLHQHHVILVGIDTPSVDPFDSKDLPSHKTIHEKNMAILEGIVLSEVEEGLYSLVALPLKMRNADASPVRAILVEDEKSQ
jgi:arylformamidase